MVLHQAYATTNLCYHTARALLKWKLHQMCNLTPIMNNDTNDNAHVLNITLSHDI